MLRLGLVSDTHLPDRLRAIPPGAERALGGVDLVLHAGDVGEVRVLDDLARLAPVVAVHGNDEGEEARRELPYQVVLALAGRRVLLWHSHFPDRDDEMAFRAGPDRMERVFDRQAERALRVGASVAVYGHTHLPTAVRHRGVLLVNPGALASGNALLRQTKRSVAVLEVSEEGEHVEHVDVDTGEPFAPDAEAGDAFTTAATAYSASLLAPGLRPLEGEVLSVLRRHRAAVEPPLLEAARRCWAGERTHLERGDLIAAFAALPPGERADALRRLGAA